MKKSKLKLVNNDIYEENNDEFDSFSDEFNMIQNDYLSLKSSIIYAKNMKNKISPNKTESNQETPIKIENGKSVEDSIRINEDLNHELDLKNYSDDNYYKSTERNQILQSSQKNVFLTNSYKNQQKMKKFNKIKHPTLKNMPEVEKDFEELNKLMEAEFYPEDEYQTEQYFIKRLISDSFITYFAILSVYSGMAYNYFKINYILVEDDIDVYLFCKQISIITVTISNIFFLILTILRYNLLLKLKKSSREILEEDGLYSSKYYIEFFFELILCILSPNVFLENIEFKTSASLNLLEVKYSLNDLLNILLILRVYTIPKYFISCTRFFDVRASRVSKMLGQKLSRLFAIRCLLMVDPYFFLFIVSVLLVFVHTFMLWILESPVNGDFKNLINCVWCIVITMASVGYGDYVTTSNFSRLVCVSAGFIGNIILSFVVVALTNYLKFNENELKAFEYKTKLEMKLKMDEKVSSFFLANYRYIITKKKYTKALRSKEPKQVVNRLKFELKKCLYKQIRNKREYKLLLHKFMTVYDPLTEFKCIKEKLGQVQEEASKGTLRCTKNTNISKEICELVEKLRDIKHVKQKI